MIAVQKLVTYMRSIKTQLPHTDMCICRDRFVSVSLVSVTSYNDTYLWYVLFYTIVHQDHRSLGDIHVETADPQIVWVLHKYDDLEHFGQYDHTQIKIRESWS